MSVSGHPKPGSSRSGPGAVGGGLEQGHHLLSARPWAPVPSRAAWAPRAEGLPGLQQQPQLSGGLCPVPLEPVRNHRLGPDANPGQEGSGGSGPRAGGSGPCSWFYGPTASLRETINQAANGLPAGRGSRTSHGVGVQPPARLPGGGRGLEGDEGRREAQPCLGGRGTAPGSGRRGITAQECIPPASPWCPRPAAPYDLLAALVIPNTPLPQGYPTWQLPWGFLGLRPSPTCRLEVPRNWGSPPVGCCLLDTQSCLCRPEALPLGAPCECPIAASPGLDTEGRGFTGFCAV